MGGAAATPGVGDVKIRDKSGRDALTLPRVSASISWWTAIGEFRLRNLEIDRPDLDIRRDTDGNLFVAGIFVPTQGKTTARDSIGCCCKEKS